MTTLSSEEMLCRLQMMEVETRGIMANCIRLRDKWLRTDPKKHPRATFNAAMQENMAGVHAKEAAALQQVIAILKVLTHPDFYQLEDFGRPVDLCDGVSRTYLSFQRLKSNEKHHFTGETVIEVLLKAHAARKSTPNESFSKE